MFLPGSLNPGQAATFTAGSVAQLIDAINTANQNGEPDFISLSAGHTYTLTGIHNAVNGSNGLPTIADHNRLTIIGNGAVIERSSANGIPEFRLLNVAAGASLALQNLTLQRGRTRGDGVQYGGAIYNAGSLSLFGVTVQHNVAQGRNGSFGIQGNGGPGFPGYGGGIYSSGALIVENSTIYDNQALGGAGGFSSCTGTSCHDKRGGRGGDGLGGGIYAADGTTILRYSTVTGNLAQSGAGGSGPNHGSPGIGSGGGLFIGIAQVGLDEFTDDHVIENSSSTSSPDIAGPYELIPNLLSGDYNDDGMVDAADFVVWRKGLGMTYSQNDYGIWRSHFGESAGSGMAIGSPSHATVPEPLVLAMPFVGTLALVFRRRAVGSAY
jgi:hypothetical protein